MEIIAIRTRYGKNGYLCWQETFWLAFQRENNVVVKLGVARSTPFSGRIQNYPKGFQIFPNDIQICHVNFRYFQVIIRNVQRDFRPFQMIFRFVM